MTRSLSMLKSRALVQKHKVRMSSELDCLKMSQKQKRMACEMRWRSRMDLSREPDRSGVLRQLKCL